MLFVGCFIADSDRVVSTAGRQRRGGRGTSERDVTPPLLAKVQGNLEVWCQIWSLFSKGQLVKQMSANFFFKGNPLEFASEFGEY